MAVAMTTALTMQLTCVTAASAAELEARRTFSIPSQPLTAALLSFSKQANIQVMTASADLSNLTSTAVSGEKSAQEALNDLLQNTGLKFHVVSESAVSIEPIKDKGTRKERISLLQATGRENPDAQAAREGPPSDASVPSRADEGNAGSIPEVLVTGSRTLNMDIRRTRDDVQPYVIFDRTVIEESGASSVEEFLRRRLPMNAQAQQGGQVVTAQGPTASINLRGLGSAQTLILVDGRRIADHYQQGNPAQSDINGIPLSAIERIEVLPTTASGIYGGGATGGVINLILKRNYTGIDARASYENTFDTDAGTRRIDLSGGKSFNDGRTSFSFAGSYQTGNRLSVADRDFVQDARARIMANNPASFLPPFAPPLGATPNIRSAVAGTNLTLKQGSQPLNSQFTSVPVGYAGPASDNGLALLGNAGRYNLDLADSAQQHGARQSLMFDPTIRSAIATLRHEFTPRVSAFLEAAANDNDSSWTSSRFPAVVFNLPASAPISVNPFEQAIQVMVPSSEGEFNSTTSSGERRVAGGVIVGLPGAWKMNADYVWSRSEYEFAFGGGLAASGNARVQSGAIGILQDTAAYPLGLLDSDLAEVGYQTPIDAVLRDATLRFAGPVMTLPGGPATLTVAVQRRDQDFSSAQQVFPAAATTFVFPSRSQSVENAYAEMRLPLVSKVNSRRWARDLELQLAARRDEYTVNGVTSALTNPTSATPVSRVTGTSSSNNPTLGFRWQPVEDLMLRASYGTGFLPPTVNQVLPTPGIAAQTFIDPRRGGQPVTLQASQLTGGGNPNLDPEKSTSRSLGFVLTPRVIPNLRLSVDYTSIDKDDVILTLALQTAVNNEAYLPGRVTRGPNEAGDLAGWAGPVTSVDFSAANLSRGEVEAYDISLDYRLETARLGVFELFALGTRQTHYLTQVVPTAPMVENAGISYSYPLKFRGNGGVRWSRGPLTLGWTVQYMDAYLVENPVSASYASLVLSQGNAGRVPSQTYHDLFASYRFSGGFMSGAELQAGIKNVLNEQPPFDARASFAYYYSPFGDVRQATYRIGLKWSY